MIHQKLEGNTCRRNGKRISVGLMGLGWKLTDGVIRSKGRTLSEGRILSEGKTLSVINGIYIPWIYWSYSEI